MIHGLLTAAAITGFVCLPLWLMTRRDARAAAQQRHPSNGAAPERHSNCKCEAVPLFVDIDGLVGEIESYLTHREPPR